MQSKNEAGSPKQNKRNQHKPSRGRFGCVCRVSCPTIRMPHQIQVEVCIESVESARAAEEGGATRVELCSALPVGGITPSAGLIAMVRRTIKIPLHVLIRPRAGDFSYTDDEFDVMKRDILLARQLGANGVALGVLNSHGDIDVDRTRSLVEAADPMQVTFHRAFDVARNRELALPLVFATGATRILTSGGAATALQGTAALKKLVVAAGPDISIMAAGKIRPGNVAELIRATGVREIHANLGTELPARPQHDPQGPKLALFHDPPTAVSAQDVADLVQAAASTS